MADTITIFFAPGDSNNDNPPVLEGNTCEYLPCFTYCNAGIHLYNKIFGDIAKSIVTVFPILSSLEKKRALPMCGLGPHGCNAEK